MGRESSTHTLLARWNQGAVHFSLEGCVESDFSIREGRILEESHKLLIPHSARSGGWRPCT